MELTNEFRVSAEKPVAWQLLTDVERIAPMLPGAQLQEIDGDEYRGVVKVKVGPITAQYKGTATFVEQDEAAGRVALRASGRDTRGQGNANAIITAVMVPDGTGTKVKVTTDLTVTGKVAQFGRGVLADVSGKLIGQFVDALEADLEKGPPVVEPAAPPKPTAADRAAAPKPAAGDRAAAAGTSPNDTPTAAAARATAAGAAAAGASQPAAGTAAAGSGYPAVGTGAAGSGDPAVGTGAAGSGDLAVGTGVAGSGDPAARTAAAGSGDPAVGTGASGSGDPAAGTEVAGAPAPAAGPRRINSPEPQPVDLLNAAGGSVMKRLAPIAGAIGAMALVLVLRRRRAARRRSAKLGHNLDAIRQIPSQLPDLADLHLPSQLPAVPEWATRVIQRRK